MGLSRPTATSTKHAGRLAAWLAQPLLFIGQMKTVLVVDDEVEIAKALLRLLRREFKVEIAHNAAEALARLEQGPVDLIISDFRMPGMNGAELLAESKRRWPTTIRIMLSGYADFDSLLASVNEGEVCRFLRKPWNDGELLALLRRILASQELATALYNPFRGGAAVLDQTDSSARVTVRMSGGISDRAHTVALIRKFMGTLQEGDAALVGGLLEQHGGRLSFTAEMGGEQKLTLEVPLADQVPAGSSR